MSSAAPERFGRRDSARPWLERYPAPVPHQLQYPNQPLWSLLEEAASRFPTRVACQYYRQQIRYEELGDLARRAAASFQRLGVCPGDRVGILLPNIPEFLIAAYGAWMAGGIVVALNPLMVARDISDLVAATNCRIVVSLDLLSRLTNEGPQIPDHSLQVTLKDRLPHWQRLGYAAVCLRRNGIRRRGTPGSRLSFSAELAKPARQFEAVWSPSEAPAFILPTGGTTGHPKAVVLTHGNLMANAWQLLHWTDNRIGEESLLAVVPFFHSYGLSTCAITGVAAAATMIMHHRFKLGHVLKLIQKYRPTCFPAVPAMLYALNEQLAQQPRNGKLLSYCISGGAPLDPDVAERFAEYSGAIVVEGYGLSEASPVTHVGPLDGTSRRGTIGLPLPDTDARVVDAETGQREMPVGEVGELLIRGPQVMQGFWKDLEATRSAIRDGWLYTGDLASRDDDGFFRIVDRKKDLIITSGFNVYPAEVEAVLRRCPGVADAAVVGIPDPGRGEIVKAVLVPDPQTRFHRAAFDRFVQKHLAKQKRPRLVEVHDGDLPRNFLGKVLRRNLRTGKDHIETPSHDVTPTFPLPCDDKGHTVS